MPKKGNRNAQETAEEHEANYIKLRHAHSAIESNINSLAHHGLVRSRDKGKRGYGRCVGLGILAYNLHQIGNGIQTRAEQAQEKSQEKESASRATRSRLASKSALPGKKPATKTSNKNPPKAKQKEEPYPKNQSPPPQTDSPAKLSKKSS